MSRRPTPWVRIGVDFGAPAAFLIGFLVTRDIEIATAALVAGSVLALGAGFLIERRLAPLPLLAGLAAIVFGGLTLILHDDFWVKFKPTVINLFFALFLLGGVAMRRSPLKMVLGEVMRLPDPLWRTLAIRYGVYFLFIAGLNEAVRLQASTEVWAWFRFPGLQLLALAFSATQFPLMLKGARIIEAEDAEAAAAAQAGSASPGEGAGLR